MNIEATKLELMELLLQTRKETLLYKLKKVFEEEQTDWWNDLDDEEKEEIKLGLKQAENGDVIPHEEAMKRFEKWH